MGAALYLVNNLSQPALPQAESSKSCSPNSSASSRYLSLSSQAKPAGKLDCTPAPNPITHPSSERSGAIEVISRTDSSQLTGLLSTTHNQDLRFSCPSTSRRLLRHSLVLLPPTQPVHIALWPVTAILAFRAATSLDMCMEQPKLAFMNIDLQYAPLNGQMEPFISVARRSSTDMPKQNLVLDAIDLDWSQRLYIPPETHPTSSGLAFVTSALSFSPDTFGSVDGGTIFDDSLSPHLHYLRSSIIAMIIMFLGGNPLSLLFGRIGGVIGTFLVSRFIHHLTLLPFDPSSEMWRMMLPFGMMGTGMVIERAVSGNKTGDWMGWMWTMCWMLLWGNVMVDGWAKAGMLGSLSILDSATPIRQLIEWLFDEYLHAIGRKP
ncbi:uncharacterized protein F5891DRAFT_1182596 [Suillus fuscotomentosus]|uniref:Wax synthase domain-containing protein n=1 Tax=Suillus fuscotomentosus TaxID=1912939 RepID=A0AAD4EJV9_9AGAM|nr:uncharacterized protein F5891DRAFT_1182596 [Suillus fuscotomentosus]KAG1906348.1 hypothetical protein F5891DRAFT_1182596 [Suillus fuscotomentosus]